MPPALHPILTPADLASRWGVDKPLSRKTVRDWVFRFGIANIGTTRHPLYLAEDVDAARREGRAEVKAAARFRHLLALFRRASRK